MVKNYYYLYVRVLSWKPHYFKVIHHQVFCPTVEGDFLKNGMFLALNYMTM